MLALTLIGALPLQAASNGKGNDGNSGQNSGHSAGKGNPSKPAIKDSDRLIGDLDPSAPVGIGNGNGARQPERPNTRTVAESAKVLVTNFKTSREAYLANQKALLRQYKDSTQEERRAIRDRMKELLSAFKEQQRSFRDDIRNRARSIRDELNPSLGRAVGGGNGGETDRGR